MEGEGNYFKACILERVAFCGGCQFEKWRLCNSQHNPIDWFHSSMCRVCGNNGNYVRMQITIVRAFPYTIDRYSAPYGVLWYSDHSVSVLQHPQLILLNFPRIACTSISLLKITGAEFKSSIPPPAEHCKSRIPWTRLSAAEVLGTRKPATSAYIA